MGGCSPVGLWCYSSGHCSGVSPDSLFTSRTGPSDLASPKTAAKIESESKAEKASGMPAKFGLVPVGAYRIRASTDGPCRGGEVWPGTCREPNDRTRVGAYRIRASADAGEFGLVHVGAYRIRLTTRPRGAERSCQPGTKKGIPICLGMPFNHSGVSVGRMQFAPTTGYPIPPAT